MRRSDSGIGEIAQDPAVNSPHRVAMDCRVRMHFKSGGSLADIDKLEPNSSGYGRRVGEVRLFILFESPVQIFFEPFADLQLHDKTSGSISSQCICRLWKILTVQRDAVRHNSRTPGRAVDHDY